MVSSWNMDLTLQLLISMKKTNGLQILLFLITAVTLTSCAPEAELTSTISESVTFSGIENSELNEQLAKTGTGKMAIQDLNNYIAAGYSVSIKGTTAAALIAENGHDGGKYDMNVEKKKITIFINSALPANEQAHVIVHELSHIKDDVVVEKVLAGYPNAKSMTNYLISSYKYRSINEFDPKAIKFVLTTLFCTEARAYSQNQKLVIEGLSTDFFSLGNNAAEFIDQNYIKQFKTSYASQAPQLYSWCINKPSMEEVTKQLVW